MKKWIAVFIVVIGWATVCPICPAHTETTAYIANGGGDEVLQVSTGDERIETVSVAGNPYGIAVTPDGLQVLVTKSKEDELAFIDTDDFSAAPFQLSVGSTPRGVAIDPTGNYAYVANFDDDTITEIYIPGQTVTDTMDVKDGPLGVAVHYDEVEDIAVVYVANHLGDSVTVIDYEGQTTITRVGDGPTGLAITPDGAQVFVANTNDDTVAIIDTDKKSISTTVTVGSEPWGVAVGAEGKYAYVTNSGEDTVTVIRTADHTIARTFTVGQTPRGISAPRNGSFAYVINQEGGSISKIDMDDGFVSQIAPGIVNDAFSIGAFIGDRPPNPPGDLELEVKDDNCIVLRWVDNSDNEKGFKIEKRRDSEDTYHQIATVAKNKSTYQSVGLESETVYYYRIRSFNEAANSDYSESSNAETMPYTGPVWCFIHSLLQ